MKAKPLSAAPALSGDLTAEQPFLLDLKSLPLRQDLVLLCKAKSFLFSGKILTKDEELCRAVCRDLVTGLSGRKIAKKYRISRNSILGIERVMRERGELEPLKKAVLAQLDDIIFLGLERIKEGIAEDEIHPGQLPIPISALIDKRGQLEAGIVPGTDRTVLEVTAEQVRTAFNAMKRLSVVSVSDTKSEVAVSEPKETGPIPAQDTSLATTSACPGSDLAGARGPGRVGVESRAEGGGGSGRAASLEELDGKASENFGAKDLL